MFGDAVLKYSHIYVFWHNYFVIY